MSGLNGFTKSVTTTFGQTYPGAVWKLDMMRIISTSKGRRASLHFKVWATAEDKATGKQPVAGILEDSSFVTRDTDYDTYFAPAVIDAADKNHFSQGYVFAKARLNDESIVDIED